MLREMARILNEALALDPAAITAMVKTRCPCNQALADHPTIIAGEVGGGFDLGLVGLINGVASDYGDRMYVKYDESTGAVVEFGIVADLSREH